MEINISKIVSANDLDLNVPKIIRKLQEQDELIIFENNKPQFVIMALEKAVIKEKPGSNSSLSETSMSVRIGKYVQDKLRELFYSDTLSSEEINRLTDKQYSKDVFNLNFSVLLELNPDLPFDKQKRDENGYNRYYNFTLQAYGKQYLLCSQWVDHLHREYFEKWLHSLV
jgi:hypothetical protein